MSNQSVIEDKQFYIFNATLDTVNTLSLIGAFFVVSVVFLSNFLKCKASKRLSFRLSMWIALADLVFCILSYIHLNLYENVRCNIINSIGYFSNLLYVFLSAAMAFNLQMVFVKQQHDSRFSEKFYVLLCVALALFVISPYFLLSVSLDSCGLYSLLSFPYNLLVFWLILCLWETISIVFCLVAIIRVTLKLLRYQEDITISHITPNPNNFNESTLEVTETSAQQIERITNSIQNRVEQVVRRIIFYPLIPIITQTPYIIMANKLLYTKADLSNIEQYLYYVPSYTAGLLNAIVFLFDPALPEIWLEIKAYLFNKKKYHNTEKFSKDDDTTRTLNRSIRKLKDYVSKKPIKPNNVNQTYFINDNDKIGRLSYYQFDVTLPGDISMLGKNTNPEESWRYFGTAQSNESNNSNKKTNDRKNLNLQKGDSRDKNYIQEGNAQTEESGLPERLSKSRISEDSTIRITNPEYNNQNINYNNNQVFETISQNHISRNQSFAEMTPEEVTMLL